MTTASSSRHLVLASGSPRRRDLLRGLGLDPRIRPVDIDESPRAGEAAEAYVRRLAESKARARGDAGELILAADTVVAIDGELLGKPVDREMAYVMLRRLAGRRHQVLTGVAVWDPHGDRLAAEVATTAVTFAALTDEEIRAYVDTGESMDKAGAYAVQGRAAVFVERLDGTYSNVVGLPLNVVYRMLADFGLPLWAAATRQA